MPMVTLKKGCASAIKSFLEAHRLESKIRIALRFTGCCDASLGLIADTPSESDRIHETDGLVFMMSPGTYDVAGDITIDYTDDASRKGFLLTSTIPVSEWQGFAPCGIELKGSPSDHQNARP